MWNFLHNPFFSSLTEKPPEPYVDSMKDLFQPPASFSKTSHFKSVDEYKNLYARFAENPEASWADYAHKELVWNKPFSKVLKWEAPFARWFEDGELNASVQCLDQHLSKHGSKTALIWEGEPGDMRHLTYKELFELTCQTANVLKSFGVKKGDRVAIYMPLVPEAVAAMLACARLGAIHSVVFGGFSAESLKDRINDAQAKVVITADGGWRRGQVVALKAQVDKALLHTPSVQKVLVLERTKNEVEMKPGRDVWWHESVPQQKKECAPVNVGAEDELFILYTSGTTGKPKGIVHTTGGFCLQTKLTTKWVFDIQENDIYWCTADIGWITGHSYVVYGPLQTGTTVMMYEGAPHFPDFSRFWKIIDRHKVTILYTAPTAIRAFIRAGDHFVNSSSLSSLRLLGSVGEPINPEAWLWYHRVVGKNRCPIVDTWWQTETGAIMISPLPGATPTKPGSCTFPLPGIFPKTVHKDGSPAKANEGAFLILERPWPSMARGIWGDTERFKKQYFSDFPGRYFTGDGARFDQDGYFWVVGRVDDVLNVSGHRLGTAEVESALVSHSKVAEAAVVGRPDDLKGQAIVAFVTLKAGNTGTDALKEELKKHVSNEIGAIARPEDIRFADGLPKTRSGKIMRRLLRELATKGAVSGDTTSLEDMNVLNTLASTYADEE